MIETDWNGSCFICFQYCNWEICHICWMQFPVTIISENLSHPLRFLPVGRKRMIFKKSRLGFANAFHLHVNSLDQNKTTQINEVSNWKSIVYESIKPLSQKVSTDIGYWASKGKPFQLQGQNLSETDKLHYTTHFRRGSRSSKNNLVSCNTLMFKTLGFAGPKKTYCW